MGGRKQLLPSSMLGHLRFSDLQRQNRRPGLCRSDQGHILTRK
jgi:hypothetical protein